MPGKPRIDDISQSLFCAAPSLPGKARYRDHWAGPAQLQPRAQSLVIFPAFSRGGQFPLVLFFGHKMPHRWQKRLIVICVEALNISNKALAGNLGYISLDFKFSV